MAEAEVGSEAGIRKGEEEKVARDHGLLREEGSNRPCLGLDKMWGLDRRLKGGGGRLK